MTTTAKITADQMARIATARKAMDEALDRLCTATRTDVRRAEMDYQIATATLAGLR